MMKLSRLAEQIEPSATIRLNAQANALRAAGEPVVFLGGGEPHAKAPDDAISATRKLAKTGLVRYAPAAGTPAMKQAIIDYTDKHYGLRVKPENVIASTGAKQSLMVCLHSILDPGDEVIYLKPYWVSYPHMVRIAGGVPVEVAPSGPDFQPHIEDITECITERTRAILINSPNNPTGVVYEEKFIREVVALSETRGIFLIMDDIYQRLVFGDKRPASVFDFTTLPLDESPVVVINGVSKQYAMTGYRIGWGVAAPALIASMTRIQAHETSGPSALGLVASVAALEGCQDCVEKLCSALRQKRDVLLEELADFPNIHVTPSDGTFYSFVDFRHYDSDSSRLASFLIDKVKVVTIPGVAFGRDGYLRISFCGPEEEIREGIRRIRWALDPTQGDELKIGDKVVTR